MYPCTLYKAEARFNYINASALDKLLQPNLGTGVHMTNIYKALYPLKRDDPDTFQRPELIFCQCDQISCFGILRESQSTKLHSPSFSSSVHVPCLEQPHSRTT